MLTNRRTFIGALFWLVPLAVSGQDTPSTPLDFVEVSEDDAFIAMHLYPEKGKIGEAIKTLRRFAVGKPVIIEETFPLKCSPDEMEQFIDQSQPVASGWISFYWGKTPEECRKGGTIGEAIMADWLEWFPKKLVNIDRLRFDKDSKLKIKGPTRSPQPMPSDATVTPADNNIYPQMEST